MFHFFVVNQVDPPPDYNLTGYNEVYGLYGVCCSSGINFDDAESYCNSTYGTNLASIHSEEEHSISYSLINSRNGWIGLNDRETDGTYIWNDGSPFDYDNWHPGEPNNGGSLQGCVALWNDNDGEWEDWWCTTESAVYCFLCNEINPTQSPS